MDLFKSLDYDAPQYVDFLEESPAQNPQPTFSSSDGEHWGGQSSPGLHDEVFHPRAGPSQRSQIGAANRTDSEKMVARPGLLPKRLSKSDGNLNCIRKVVANKKSLMQLAVPKKSLSESCIKTIRIKVTTPTCLKRKKCTKLKTVKTTEELELEKIAKLQQETYHHLRVNEQYLRKMGLQQKTSALPQRPKPLSNFETGPKYVKDVHLPIERVRPTMKTSRFPISRSKPCAEGSSRIKLSYKDIPDAARNLLAAAPKPQVPSWKTASNSALQKPQPSISRTAANLPTKPQFSESRKVGNLPPKPNFSELRKMANLPPKPQAQNIAAVFRQSVTHKVPVPCPKTANVKPRPPANDFQKTTRTVKDNLPSKPTAAPQSIASLFSKTRPSSLRSTPKTTANPKPSSFNPRHVVIDLLSKVKHVAGVQSVNASNTGAQSAKLPSGTKDNAVFKVPFKKYEAHSGLPLTLNYNKKTIVKPFSFTYRSKSTLDDSAKNDGRKAVELNIKKQLSTSLSPQSHEKENVFNMKP